MNQVVLSKIVNFLQQENNPLEILKKYSSIVNHVMYAEPDIINSIVRKMKNNIISWAKEKSLVYRDYSENKIYSRENLLDKSCWYVEDRNMDFIDCHTSGSTTGDRFYYRITKKYHDLLENNNQYGLILNEFNLPKYGLKILSLIPSATNPHVEGESFGSVHQLGPLKHAYHGHMSRTSIRHFVRFDNYIKDPAKWHEDFLNFVADKDLDIILSSGPVINNLKNYLYKNPTKIKLCKLLSHTSQFPIKEDFHFLKDNNYIDNYCDSMRCWDGGATFFTCVFGTYHLLDSVTYCYEVEQKLISTDYFSIPAPFINYWNGDICEIKQDYIKCNCGRWYRPFKLLQNRPFELKGPTKLTEIKAKIQSLLFKENIKQIQFSEENVQIITNVDLKNHEKEQLKIILCDYNLIFNVY